MATLSICTLLPLNSEFRFNPVRRSFRTTVQCHRMNSHVSKWGKVKRVEFDRFRCFSINDKDGGDGEGESGNKNDSKSNVTTVLPEEDRGFSSDKSTTPSTSKRSFLGYLSMVSQADSVKLMELLGIEKVDPADVKLIKDKLFGISTFWVTKEEPFGDFGEGVLFIGNLRGKREDVFSLLQDRLVEATGDKYYLFMVEEPDSDSLDLDSLDLNSLDLDSLYLDSLYSNSPDPRGGPRVSFGLLRKELYEPKETTLCQYVIASLLFFLTIRTSVELGISSQINRLPPELVKFLTNPNYKDMELLYPALPVAYGVLGVLLFHEVGHFLAAFPKQVKLSIPFFIPHITLGSFGAITQFKSILPDRSTQVDISLAGPFAGTVLSFSMFAVGLLLSSNPDAAGDLVQVPSTLFQGSLLLGLISRATLGYVAIHAATVSIHPLVIAGWCGLTIQAFNMLPVGRLDGGRSVQGAFGKDALFLFSLTTYLLLGLGVLGGPLSLAWGCYVIFAQISQERPCLNDVTEVGAWRQTFVGVAIFLAVLTLLPVSDELADELGIGLDSSFHGYL